MEKPHLIKSAEVLGLTLKTLNGMNMAEFGKFWRSVATKFHPDNYASEKLTDEQIKEKEAEFSKMNEAKSAVEEFLENVNSVTKTKKRKRDVDSLCETEETKVASKKPKELQFGYIYLELTEEQLLRGDKRDYDVEVNFTRECRGCSGTGGQKGVGTQCHFCNGYGRVYSEISDDGETNTVCPVCKGVKTIPTKDESLCKSCDGAGIEKVTYIHRVHVKHTAARNSILGSADLKNGAELIFEKIFIVLLVLNKS